MHFRNFFLWISVIFLVHTVVLVCFFHDKIIHFKLLSSTSISISNYVADNSDQHAMIEELEKMWQEKLIEDLFRGTAAAPNILVEETLDQDEGPTTRIYRKHTMTPERRDFEDTFGDQFAGQKLRESIIKDLSLDEKEPLAQTGKDSQTQNLVVEIQETVVEDPIVTVDPVKNESSESKVKVEPAEPVPVEDSVKNESSESKVKVEPAEPVPIEEEDSQVTVGEVSENPITLKQEEDHKTGTVTVPDEEDEDVELPTLPAATTTNPATQQENGGNNAQNIPESETEVQGAGDEAVVEMVKQNGELAGDMKRSINEHEVKVDKPKVDVKASKGRLDTVNQQQLNDKSQEIEIQRPETNEDAALKKVPLKVPLKKVPEEGEKKVPEEGGAVKASNDAKEDDEIEKSDKSENIGAQNNEPTTPPPKQPKMVLVLTQSRHGSTWLMDVLSVRDEAVPVFEPLNSAPFLKMYALSDEVREETLAAGYDPVKYEDWREVYLARICICDWHGVKIPGRKDKHFQAVMGLGYKAKRLGTEYRMQYRESMVKCLDDNTMMVPKTIRYYNMSTLYKIQDFGCDNFKVIHLVRDPRAVLNSRMSVFHELYDGNKFLGAHIRDKDGQAGFDEAYMTTAADWMCSHHLHNYKLGMNPPPWLKDRYKMVRYEDLAESPQHWTRELLHFIGVKYTPKYKEYVYNLTHVKDRGKKDGGWYGVERQSSEMVDSWKKKLIEPHWRTIERVCADMMEAFNYKPTFFNSEE